MKSLFNEYSEKIARKFEADKRQAATRKDKEEATRLTNNAVNQFANIGPYVVFFFSVVRQATR